MATHLSVDWSFPVTVFLSCALCFPSPLATFPHITSSSPLPPAQERLKTDETEHGRRRRHVASLHGDLPQVARDAAIGSLRSGQCDVLVATDVAARGLDLPGVELVVHADLPKTADAYAHRAGRAGRPGCAARGVSLLLPMPGPESAAAISGLERDAKVSICRLHDLLRWYHHERMRDSHARSRL